MAWSVMYASPWACQNLASTMKTGRVMVGASGVGRLVTKRTVYGSGASTRATVSTRGSCCDLYAGSRIFSTVNFTSADVKGSPLANATPRRSRNSQTVGAIRRHEVASCGHQARAVGRAAGQRVVELRVDVGVGGDRGLDRVERARVDALRDRHGAGIGGPGRAGRQRQREQRGGDEVRTAHCGPCAARGSESVRFASAAAMPGPRPGRPFPARLKGPCRKRRKRGP